jgi:hypothetical protein
MIGAVLDQPDKDIIAMGEILGKLLNVAHIQQLVVIDDWYIKNEIDIEVIVATAQASPVKYADLIPELATLESDETEHISSIVKRALEDTTIAEDAWKICMAGDDENAKLDSRTMSVFERLVSAIPVKASVRSHFLSGSEWDDQANIILDPINEGTLILVDRDFAREGKSANHGLTVISGLLQEHPNGVHCALLSHTVAPGDELDQWVVLSETHGIPQHKFVVISKTRLADGQDDLAGFLNLMRLSILCGPLQVLRDKVRDHFENALDTTRTKLGAWSVFDFDEAIFASSRNEGVWEGETLLRVMTTFMARSARTGVLGDPEVRSTINLARQASSVKIPFADLHPWKSVGRMALEYQQSELYHKGSSINVHHLPLEAGDVFDRGDDKESYILLAQPCDLMVRESTGRAYDSKLTKMVPLCLVTQKRPEEGQSYELKCWNDDGSPAHVHFSQIHMVRVSVLDLCVLHPEGRANFDRQPNLPDTLTESWRQHATKLLKLWERESAHADQLKSLFQHKESSIPKQLRTLAVSKILPCCSNTGRFKYNPTQQGFSVNLRRIRRISPLLTSDILRGFSQFQCRTAFDQSVMTDELLQKMEVAEAADLKLRNL